MSRIEITLSVLRGRQGRLVGLAVAGVGQTEAEFFAHRFFHHLIRGRTRINVDPHRGVLQLVHPHEGTVKINTTTTLASEIHTFVRQKRLLRRAFLTRSRIFGVSSAIIQREYASDSVQPVPINT